MPPRDSKVRFYAPTMRRFWRLIGKLERHMHAVSFYFVVYVATEEIVLMSETSA